MVRIYIVGFTFLWFVAGVFGSNSIELSPKTIDLGEIWEGQGVGVTTQVKNKTGKSIELGELRTSCSCVTTKVSDNTIEPHSHVQVDFKLVRNKPGDFRDIVLISNKDDGTAQAKRFSITGKVRPAYTMKGNWLAQDDSTVPTMEFIRNKVCFLPNFNLPKPKNKAEPRLRIYIDGSRPEDPVVEGASVNVNSSLFKLVEHNIRTDKGGKMHCMLLLSPFKELEQGLYPDRLIIELGPDLKLGRRISFRVIGPVWSEKATLNFGSAGPGKVSPREVILHFQPEKTVWSQVCVIGTEPETYSKAVTITDVAWDGKSKHTKVALALDPTMMTDTIKGFFHFKLFLGNKHTDLSRAAVEDADIVKLHVYGMVVGGK